jgi:sterol desaturase/sphingolipid hydroxylase (fatty acid hydroxylase superfamily)
MTAQLLPEEWFYRMSDNADFFYSEALIRVCFFAAIFSAVALMEKLAPRRALLVSKARRWFSNTAMQLIDTVLLRLIFPLFPIGIALICAGRGWGLLNYYRVALAPAAIAGVIALDLAIYIQHVLFHAIPLFWRVHMVHHTDRDIDVTTGLRFHPLEVILSLLIKSAAVFVSGAPPLAVLIFEIMLNGTSMFNHANLRLPLSADRAIRMILVTPDMHRVHHSIIMRETNSNYGFSFSLWDRIFGTYRAQPLGGHADMKIGLANYQDDRPLKLSSMLVMPFLYGR